MATPNPPLTFSRWLTTGLTPGRWSFKLSPRLSLKLGLAIALPPILTQPTIVQAQVQAQAQAQPLFIAYPPANHETTSDRIFLIGTAAPQGTVTVNGKPIPRNAAGHFAPSVPLQLGNNRFTLQYGSQTLNLSIKRNPSGPQLPQGLGFAADSLTPAVNVARLPGEMLCFGAIARPGAEVSVSLAGQTLPLQAQPSIDLPPNNAVLTGLNQPTRLANSSSQRYEGCLRLGSINLGSAPTLHDGEGDRSDSIIPGPNKNQDLGIPSFEIRYRGKTVKQPGKGSVTLLSPVTLPVIEVTAEQGTARTGPSTDYSRLTPLPKGTRAQVTGREANWYRLDYGGWIRENDVKLLDTTVPPRSLIRSVSSRIQGDWTEVVFPLQVPVPLSIQQDGRRLTLTLYNTTAQTDTIYTRQDPLIARLDWSQPQPGQVQYTLQFKTDQQWGFKTRYEGTTLILSLKHPPRKASQPSPAKPLQGWRIFLDPGHGSVNDLGARGPNGYPEKDVVLTVSNLLRQELQQRGATVLMSREGDEDLYPQDRVDKIQAAEPDLALSLHYNALPDNGDALKTQGIGMFWYHPQAHGLAQFLHDHLVRDQKRPSYGVFWNNLALTRPSLTPAVLLELGFMINPDEFVWIVDPAAQKALARSLAEGLALWVSQR